MSQNLNNKQPEPPINLAQYSKQESVESATMELAISNHGGQYQFWHMDCKKGDHETPMNSPKYLANNVKEFKCDGCGKKGRITLSAIVPGRGTLIEISE